MPNEVLRLRALLAPGGEAAGWGTEGGRLRGRFWVMGSRTDGAGTVCLSEDPRDPSYVALGMARSIAETLTRSGHNTLPALFQLTLLPFLGRLVTDGLMNAVDAGRPVAVTGAQLAALRERERDGTLVFFVPPPPESAADDAKHDAAACADVASCAVCARMRAAAAICGLAGCWRRGRCDGGDGLLKCGSCRAVAYCGTEHQIADWKRHKGDCRASAAAKAESDAAAAAPLTANEKAMAKRIAAKRSDDDVMWTVRRLGYDEQENPSACTCRSAAACGFGTHILRRSPHSVLLVRPGRAALAFQQRSA